MSATKTLPGIRKAFKQKGGLAMQSARKQLLQFKDDSYSSQALRYLSKVTLHSALPVFPALTTWAYEAAGGKEQQILVPFEEALLLISFAADMHDDVIDQSVAKGEKLTVFGKFGAPTAILAGDILLVEGLKQLTVATENLPKDQLKEIMKWVSEAVFEICTAEALQFKLKSKPDVTPDEYSEVIRLKSVVPELCMKIGARVASNSKQTVDCLGHYGRIYGINSVIVEEFADLLNLDEFKNRLKNEVVPLPMIYATQNPTIKTKLNALLEDEIDSTSHEQAVDVILNSTETDELHKVMLKNANLGQNWLHKVVEGKIEEELKNLLLVPLSFFET